MFRPKFKTDGYEMQILVNLLRYDNIITRIDVSHHSAVISFSLQLVCAASL